MCMYSMKMEAVSVWMNLFIYRCMYVLYVCSMIEIFIYGMREYEWMLFSPLYLGWEKMAGVINGKGALTWKLPLPPLSPTDIEPVSARLDPGEEAARYTYIHAYIYE